MAFRPKPTTMTFNCGSVRLTSPSTSVASSTAVTTGAAARIATWKLCVIKTQEHFDQRREQPGARGAVARAEEHRHASAGRDGAERVQQSAQEDAMPADDHEHGRAQQASSCEKSGTLVDVVGSKTSESVSPPTRLIRSPAIWIPPSRIVIPSPRTRPITSSLPMNTT